MVMGADMLARDAQGRTLLHLFVEGAVREEMLDTLSSWKAYWMRLEGRLLRPSRRGRPPWMCWALAPWQSVKFGYTPPSSLGRLGWAL